MTKYLIGVLIAIFGLLAYIYFFVGVPHVYQEQFPEAKTAHLYNQPDRPITEIKIAAFYFVPKNKQDFLIDNWQELLESNLKKIQEFHNLQLQGRSFIAYEIYPTPIIGLYDNELYDTTSTQYGNPKALRSIAPELEKRVLNPQGDLYRPDFAQVKAGQYLSLLIIYEGVGASGSENVGLISRNFLSESEHQAYGASILAHEFYHTLGLPDGYEIPSAVHTTQDIMGVGRMRPLEKTYLRRQALIGFGF